MNYKVDTKSGRHNNVLLIGAIAPMWTNKVTSECLPFGAMALSGFLKQHGISCRVVSTAFPEAVNEIFKELRHIDLLGISCMSGPYLSYAISVAKNIKKAKPDIPIAWGGPHASLMGNDLITENLADFVITGVGEWSLLKLIEALNGQCHFSSVPGLIWKEGGYLRSNNPLLDFKIDQLPQLDYSLLSEKYVSLLSNEFSYFSSRGCPYNCSYCVASKIYGGHWYSKSEEKVIAELQESYHLYKFKSVYFWDDNLFVNVKRLFNIFKKLNSFNISFKWSGFCRADILAKLEDREILELKENGLKWVSMGAESGSQSVLDKLDKGITVNDIKQAAIKLKKFRIPCDFSFMGGLPGESIDDFDSTLILLKWIKKNNSLASVRLFRFIPYPKMPILEDYREIGRFLPSNTQGWSEVTYQYKRFPWVSGKINRALTALSPATIYPEKPRIFSIGHFFITVLFYIFLFRVKNKFFYFPLEGMVLEKIYIKISVKLLNNFKKHIGEAAHDYQYAAIGKHDGN